MKPAGSFSNTIDISLRVIADLAIVHAAMLSSFVLAAMWLQPGAEQAVREGLAELRGYYAAAFLPLSLLFPCVYGLMGLYTRSRSYTLEFKLKRSALSAAISVMALISIGWLLVGAKPLPRSAALLFSVFVIAATPGVRFLKDKLFQSEMTTHQAIRGTENSILVVGGAGYIGSIVVRKLLSQGYRVRVLDSLVYGASAIEEVFDHPRLEFMKGDCRNIQDVVAAMTGVRAVVHLAAIVGDPACDQDQKTAREINYAATRMMIEIAKGERVERFVFASSCSVYGASDQVMDENSETRPISLYADTKVDSESELLQAANKNFHPTILRFSTIFGLSPRPRFDLVVNLLTAKAMQEEIVTIYNGQQWRPFLHVADAAEAIVRVLQAPVAVVGSQIYNVGDSRLNYTLTGVADKILERFPKTRVEHVDNSDRRSYRVSFDKIESQLGFRCSRTLESGIEELKEAFERRLVIDYRDALYSNVRFLKEHGSPSHDDPVGVQVMAALAQKTVAFAQKA